MLILRRRKGGVRRRYEILNAVADSVRHRKQTFLCEKSFGCFSFTGIILTCDT